MNNVDHWNFTDPEPNVPINQIQRASARATALIVRNRHKPLLKTDFIRIFGAIEMIEGMEYHHDNFLRLCTPVPSSQAQTQLRHEAVAYLNRMGQFHKFAHSDFVKSVIPVQTMPTFTQLMVFRHKYAAHRSIDVPKKPENSDALQLVHARSLSRLFGSLFIPRDKSRSTNVANFTDLDNMRRAIWENNCLAFQIFDARTSDHLHFCVEKDHVLLMDEAFSVLQRVILHE